MKVYKISLIKKEHIYINLKIFLVTLSTGMFKVSYSLFNLNLLTVHYFI